MASEAEDDGEVTTYQVAKFGEDHKAYHVKFNVMEMRATCSCQMFEFLGLLCGHVLAVFRVTIVLMLPSQYILKRWTRNAERSVILEEHVTDVFASYLESHTVGYSTLRHEAFKFVDEGAESVDTYNVAMVALEEAARRVALATKNKGRLNTNNGCTREDSRSNGTLAKKEYCRSTWEFGPETVGEAARRVALATKNEGRLNTNNGRTREDSRSNGTLAKKSTADQHGSLDQKLSEDDMDTKIRELNHELECVKRKSEVYRGNPLSVLRDIEDHKQQLSVKVQSIKLSMGDGLPRC